MRTRRLARDDQTLPAMHEAMVLWSMTMLARERPPGRAPPTASASPSADRTRADIAAHTVRARTRHRHRRGRPRPNTSDSFKNPHHAAA
jgi:hypothetical protein